MARFRVEFASRRAVLAAMRGIILSSPSSSSQGGERMGYCSTPGQDDLITLEEAVGLQCGDCKLHAMKGARQAIDDGATIVELCLTVSDDAQEHTFCRVDGQFRDYAVEAGMPVRQIGDFVAIQVWPVTGPHREDSMKHEYYRNAVDGDGRRTWPEQHVWISPAPGVWTHVGAFVNGVFDGDESASGGLVLVGGPDGTVRDASGTRYNIWYTPSADTDPHEWRVARGYTDTPSQQQHQQHQQHQQSRQPPQYQPQQQSPRRPVARQGGRPAVRQPAAPAWEVRTGADGYPHAWRGSVDLGLMPNPRQVVKPTNGGQLWALGDLQPDGTVKWGKPYGSVPGAPPPPNAGRGTRPPPTYQQPPPPPPPPPYADPYGQQPPQVVYQQPPPPPPYADPYDVPQVVYQQPPPQVVYQQPPPQVVYQQQAEPQYVDQYGRPIYPDQAPLGGTPGVPGYDPVTGQPLTAAQAAYLGAQQGVLLSQQQQQQQLAGSIQFGGGFMPDLGGMAGGFDAATLLYLAGGDPEVAAMLAIQNGGYDPSAGGMLEPSYY